jgi:Zn-dependent protease
MASLRIIRVAGIDIGIHPSWLVIFLLVTWSLAVAYFPFVLPDASTTTHWLLGGIASLLLFVSVIIHELAHSLVAKRLGLDVRSITLFLFGGVSNLAGESPRPGVEFLIAVVGPLSSFVIGGLAFLGAIAAPAGSAAGAVLGYLAVVNVLLGAFNLIPGFPLDGGRVLRSIVWQATGSLRRATEIAGTVGILVSYGFFIWGFLRALNGDLFGGLWIAAIGWFLQAGASASIQQTRMEESLRGTRVRDIIRPDDLSVPPGLDVQRLVESYLLPLNRRAIPVTENGRVVGIVTLGDVKDIPPERRAATRVGDVMGGREGVRTVSPDDSLADALQALAEGDWEQAPVVGEDGRLIGMLNRADVLRQFQLREVLRVEGREPSAGATGRLAGGPTAGVGR